MVTRGDIHLDNYPPESCGNCGFISKFAYDLDGGNERGDIPLNAYERFRGPQELERGLFKNRIAHLQCWMRRNFLEVESELSGLAPREAALEALSRDRSVSAGKQHCPQFTPWVPHLNFKEHWEARNVYLLERDRRISAEKLEEERRKFEERLHGSTQAVQNRMTLISVAGLVIAVIAIAVGAVVTAKYANPTVVNQIVVASPTPMPSTATPQPTLAP